MSRYKEYLNSEKRQKKRKLKTKNKKTCGICGNGPVDIHHLTYKNIFKEPTTDLRRLCRRCHYLVHDLEKSGAIKYRSDNHNSRWVIIKTAVKKHLGISNKSMFKKTGQHHNNQYKLFESS